jgi:eukaryotic translation initiation factor 2C
MYNVLLGCTLFCFKSGPWKRKFLAEFGIVTQCLAPTRVNDPYLLNLLMKINAKVWAYSIFFWSHYTLMHAHGTAVDQLGGMNSLMQMEASPSIPRVESTYHHLGYGCITWSTWAI